MHYFNKNHNIILIVIMAKKAVKKATKIPPKRGQDKKKKLPRGYKECGSCRRLLHIHKYVCDKCGFKHDMKKKKVDILKNLNKVTPKLLRSLIELDDFNCLTDMKPEPSQFSDFLLPRGEVTVPIDYKKRRSSKSQATSASSQFNWTALGSHGGYIKMNAKLVCLCPLADGEILLAESVQKVSTMTESQKITMRAFNLEQFHRVGQIYTGKSALYYFNNKKMQRKINVSDHVVAMRSICNRVGVLTGRGTVLVFDLEAVSAKNVEEKILNVHNSLEIKANAEDQITVLEWLKTHSTGSEVFLAVGTLMGHLYIFRIAGKQAKLDRFICSAHFQAITCIAECPLGNAEECLFATGSYDGTLSVWSVNQKEAIYRVQVSNRKICSLLWDPGAKFIFVLRDQNQDSGVLACFFAILKNDESVALSDQVDFRLIKNTFNCKILQDKSNRFSFIDTYQCLLRAVEVEELRKSSLKRKKVKKDEEEAVLKLMFEGNQMKVVEIAVEEQSKSEPRVAEEALSLPLISDAIQMKVSGKECVFGITYDGFMFQVNLP